MLDHVGFAVHPSKYDEVVNWYLAALAPLGVTKQNEYPGQACGLGTDKHNIPFWIAAKEDAKVTGVHLAFSAKDHETVDKFHAEALKAGGIDNGPPGIRFYHPNYYGAFVFDPVG
jgi:hypothetical protein